MIGALPVFRREKRRAAPELFAVANRLQIAQRAAQPPRQRNLRTNR